MGSVFPNTNFVVTVDAIASRMFKENVAAGEYKLSFAVSSPQYLLGIVL